MRKKVVIIIGILVFLLLAFLSMIISANKTGVLNPIAAATSIFRILWVEEDLYVVAQEKPWKIMIAKSNLEDKSAKEILDDFMKKEGYEISDQMGSVITYKNEKGYEKRIHFSVNKYYSIWEWI